MRELVPREGIEKELRLAEAGLELAHDVVRARAEVVKQRPGERLGRLEHRSICLLRGGGSLTLVEEELPLEDLPLRSSQAELRERHDLARALPHAQIAD